MEVKTLLFLGMGGDSIRTINHMERKIAKIILIANTAILAQISLRMTTPLTMIPIMMSKSTFSKKTMSKIQA